MVVSLYLYLSLFIELHLISIVLEEFLLDMITNFKPLVAHYLRIARTLVCDSSSMTSYSIVGSFPFLPNSIIECDITARNTLA